MELDVIQYEIDKETEQKLGRTLKKFIDKSGADFILLADKAGRTISFYGKNLDEVTVEFIASIISGLFGAASEMAKFISDSDEMDTIQYETRNQSVIVKAVSEKFLIGVICPKGVAIGSVRLFIRDLVDELCKHFKEIKLTPSKLVKLTPDMIEEKLNSILGQ